MIRQSIVEKPTAVFKNETRKYTYIKPGDGSSQFYRPRYESVSKAQQSANFEESYKLQVKVKETRDYIPTCMRLAHECSYKARAEVKASITQRSMSAKHPISKTMSDTLNLVTNINNDGSEETQAQIII